MPALIALLQDGTAEGQNTAREELARLARGMDSVNAAARSEEAAALARSEEAAADLKAAHARGMAEGAAAASSDLANMARDSMTGGAYVRAACYWEAAARIAPAGMEAARDFRVSADLAEREAAALQTRAYDLARKEALADTAATLAAAALDAEEGGAYVRAAGLYAAAALACPYSIHADSWGAESRACQEAAQAGRAAAVKAAFAEGRREAREQCRDSIREALDMAQSCLAAYPEGPALPTSAGAARDLRDSLSGLVAALPEAMGAF